MAVRPCCEKFHFLFSRLLPPTVSPRRGKCAFTTSSPITTELAKVTAQPWGTALMFTSDTVTSTSLLYITFFMPKHSQYFTYVALYILQEKKGVLQRLPMINMYTRQGRVQYTRLYNQCKCEGNMFWVGSFLWEQQSKLQSHLHYL